MAIATGASLFVPDGDQLRNVRLGSGTLTTGQHDQHQPSSDSKQEPADTKVRRVRQPLDRTQLWVAGIGAVGAVAAAAIAAVSAFAIGWLQYSGPGAGQQPSRAATAASSPPSSKSVPATTLPATPSASAAPSPQTAATFYLANESSVTSSGNPPESGNWAIAGTNYVRSIGYPSLCLSASTTFTISGSYKYFIATVGVADTAASLDQSTTVDFEVDDSSGNQLGSETAQYGQPQTIKVPVQGLTSITLNTSLGDCFATSVSVAVWGSARVVGLSVVVIIVTDFGVFEVGEEAFVALRRLFRTPRAAAAWYLPVASARPA